MAQSNGRCEKSKHKLKKSIAIVWHFILLIIYFAVPYSGHYVVKLEYGIKVAKQFLQTNLQNDIMSAKMSGNAVTLVQYLMKTLCSLILSYRNFKTWRIKNI